MRRPKEIIYKVAFGIVTQAEALDYHNRYSEIDIDAYGNLGVAFADLPSLSGEVFYIGRERLKDEEVS